MITRRGTLAGLMGGLALPRALWADAPIFETALASGDLPPMADRLPADPRVIDLAAMGREVGQQGGTLNMLVGGQRDVRLIPINSYARLMTYTPDLRLVTDILAHCDNIGDQTYTFQLRKGHRWSDGSPFTAEDFRYAWDDVITNDSLYKSGPPVELLSAGKLATFEVIDDLTVRYTFAAPSPGFLPELAAPLPLILFMPSAYLRQFHKTYADEASLAAHVAAQEVDDWKRLHQKMSRSIRPENPDLPTLEAWRPRTLPPAEQFVFERNPYFHRVDQAGTQLPYLDKIVLNVSSTEVIVAKTATGESDLQTTTLAFQDYPLLKTSEDQHGYKVLLWPKTKGSAVALMPNLNCADPVWRQLFRDVRMRRAMSLAVHREEINKAIFFDLAREGADTVLAESPLFRPEYATAWSSYDPDQANRLLDEIGLTERGAGNIRLLPDGRQAGIIAESAGESSTEIDVLELIRDHFRAIGLALYIRTSQRDVFRSRALAGEVQMSVWEGLDNALPNADMSPEGLAPTSGDYLQWPIWGTHYASAGESGEAPDLPEAVELIRLLGEWNASTTIEAKTLVWDRMLAIRAENVFSIGTVNGALQPLVRSARLRNLPDTGLFGFEPTSYLGAYLPDTFFFATA